MNFRRRRHVQIIRLGRSNYMKGALVIAFDVAVISLVVWMFFNV